MLVHQLLISLQHGKRVNAMLGRNSAHRGQRITFIKHAVENHVYDAVTKLLGVGQAPERSPVGLVLVAVSVIVMPTLACAKRHVAAGLGSVALRADAAQTNLCTYLSAVVLLGLAANALAGW